MTSAVAKALAGLTLEDVFAGAAFADIPASPLQLAICRAAQGRPVGDMLSPEQLQAHFGVPSLPVGIVPRLVAIIAGVRGGKSSLAVAAAIWASLTVDLAQLKRHEVPRFAILAPTVDAAKATFVLLVGTIRESKILRRFLDGEPTADTLVIRRPDGRRVEVVVVARNRGGVSLRNRWLIGAVLEEAAQLSSDAGVMVDPKELQRAAETRLLPGGQVWVISSPFGPQGYLFDLYSEYFGQPGARLVVHAPTRALVPSFPQATIDAIAAEDPDAAAREYGAQWLDPDSAHIPEALIGPNTREAPLELPPDRKTTTYVAATDPGTRGNAWPLVVIGIEGTGVDRKLRVVLARQWQGSQAAPLSPGRVLGEIAELVKPYGLTLIHTDQYSVDALRDLARQHGLQLAETAITAPIKAEAFEQLRTWLAQGLLELSPLPELRADLLAVRKRVAGASVQIVLPETPDGRHCDFAAALALGVWKARHVGTWTATTTGAATKGYSPAGDERRIRGELNRFHVDDNAGCVRFGPETGRAGRGGSGGF